MAEKEFERELRYWEARAGDIADEKPIYQNCGGTGKPAYRGAYRKLLMLRFIVDQRAKKGRSPTIAEIARHVGLSATTVVQHLDDMERMEMLQRPRGERRSIRPMT